jgi:putative transposase
MLTHKVCDSLGGVYSRDPRGGAFRRPVMPRSSCRRLFHRDNDRRKSSPPGVPRGDQRGPTFLKSHAKAIIASNSFVALTATFRELYVFVVIEHATRRLAHLNVPSYSGAEWTLQQLREALAQDRRQHLIDDRDRIDSRQLDESSEALGLEVLRSPVASPKAKAICDRGFGTIRRKCLDWMVSLTEAHLRTARTELQTGTT